MPTTTFLRGRRTGGASCRETRGKAFCCSNLRCGFRTAVEWLEQHLGIGLPTGGQAVAHPLARSASVRGGALHLPLAVDRFLDRVRQYLTQRRLLSATLIEPLIQTGRLYADYRGNAVFLLVAGKTQRPIGAELRGTGPRVWRGMAPGTRKDLGYFWIGARGSRSIVAMKASGRTHCHVGYGFAFPSPRPPVNTMPPAMSIASSPASMIESWCFQH